jgi:transposase
MGAAETIDPRSLAWRAATHDRDMRAAMNAIFYLLRTGCPWRYLPRDKFPPRSGVRP